MGNVIVVLILAAVLVTALFSCAEHFKGKGGCCGGGGEIKEKKKKFDGRKLGEKRITIDGMHCDHCKSSVERYINQIDGAAAVVNLKKNIAVVSMSRDISDEELTCAVEKAGFKVIKIETEGI